MLSSTIIFWTCNSLNLTDIFGSKRCQYCLMDLETTMGLKLAFYYQNLEATAVLLLIHYFVWGLSYASKQCRDDQLQLPMETASSIGAPSLVTCKVRLKIVLHCIMTKFVEDKDVWLLTKQLFSIWNKNILDQITLKIASWSIPGNFHLQTALNFSTARSGTGYWWDAFLHAFVCLCGGP